MTDLFVLPCPPLAKYPEPPKDQSEYELFDCPTCKEKMWISQKKKGAILFNALLNNEIKLGCYDCITIESMMNPHLFADSEVVKI